MTSLDLDDLIDRTIRQVDAAARQQRADDASPASLGLTSPVAGSGAAWDQRIRMTVTDGRLTSCEIAPVARRLTSVELAEHLVDAVNEALSDYQDHLMSALAEQQPDLTSLTGSLREIQADAVRMVGAYTDQLYDVLRRVGER